VIFNIEEGKFSYHFNERFRVEIVGQETCETFILCLLCTNNLYIMMFIEPVDLNVAEQAS
jgi:hypothetical protein